MPSACCTAGSSRWTTTRRRCRRRSPTSSERVLDSPVSTTRTRTRRGSGERSASSTCPRLRSPRSTSSTARSVASRRRCRRGRWWSGGATTRTSSVARTRREPAWTPSPAGARCWLQHTSGHMCVLNSAALRRAGRRPRRPRSTAGASCRDEAGEPTGLLEERAQALARRLAVPRSVASIAAAIGRAHDVYVREGLTSVCDAGIAGGWIGESPAELAGYQQAREERPARASGRPRWSRPTCCTPCGATTPTSRRGAWTPGLRTGLGDDVAAHRRDEGLL